MTTRDRLVLLTGATGYVGGRLLHQLESLGVRLRCMGRLGGLGDESKSLSAHLRSRHEVGAILRASGVPVIEFRASRSL